MTVSVVATDFGAFSFTGYALTFDVSALAKAGDVMVVVEANQASDDSLTTAPDGWVRVGQESASSRTGAVWAKPVADEAGGQVVFSGGGNIIVGVLFVLRGVETTSLLYTEGDGLDVNRSTLTSHPVDNTFGMQSDDIRLDLWAFEGNPSLTMPVDAKFTSLGQVYDATAGWRFGAGYYQNGAPATGGAGTLTATTAANSNAICVTACCRARPVSAPESVAPAHSGTIGLE